MLHRILALLCMAVSSFGAFPRPLADVPILAPDGKTIRLNQYRGKVMVVLIVLTTCEHCMHSVELLNDLQMEHSKDFQAVAVAVNSEAAQDASSYIKVHRLTYPFGYLTSEENIMKLADFKREDRPLSPIYMFVDRKGTVRVQYNANDPNFLKNEDKNVRALVEGYIEQK